MSIKDVTAKNKDGAKGAVFVYVVGPSSIIPHLRLQIVRQSDLVDQIFLGLDPVNVLFGVIQNGLEDLA